MKKLIAVLGLAVILSTSAAEAKVSVFHKVAYNTVHWVVVTPVRIYTTLEVTFYTMVRSAANQLDTALSYPKE